MSGYMTLVKKYAYFVSDHRKYYENKEPALAGDFFFYRRGFSGTSLTKVVGFSKKSHFMAFHIWAIFFSALKTIDFY